MSHAFSHYQMKLASSSSFKLTFQWNLPIGILLLYATCIFNFNSLKPSHIELTSDYQLPDTDWSAMKFGSKIHVVVCFFHLILFIHAAYRNGNCLPAPSCQFTRLRKWASGCRLPIPWRLSFHFLISIPTSNLIGI